MPECTHVWDTQHEDAEGYVHCTRPGCGAIGEQCDECDGDGGPSCTECNGTGWVEVPQRIG